jgi:hypothetical protein
MSVATLQSTNRVKISKVRETTFGVTPTNPAFKTLRMTGSDLNANPKTTTSNEIRSDRQLADLILIGAEAGGGIDKEVSFQALDDDFEEALLTAWVAKASIVVVTLDTEISDVSTTTLTVASGGASFKTGMLTLMSGFTTSANNKIARVSSSTATTVVYPASTFTAEAAAIPVGATLRHVGFQGASADITATASGLGSTALDFTTLNLVVGEWVKIGGSAAGDQFATAANNGWARISAIAATALTFDVLPTGWTTDTGTGKTIKVWIGDYARNGTTLNSNTIERQYLDQSPVSYESLTGMCLNTLAFDVAAEQIFKAKLSYIGKSGTTSTSRASGATDTAAPTNNVLNASTNVGRIAVNGVAVTGPNYVMSSMVTINNNLTALQAVGAMGAIGVGIGEFNVSGTLNTYFGDTTNFSYVMANTALSYDFRIGDASGNKPTYVFDLPRIKFSSGAPSVPGKNQQVMLPLNFQAILHPTLGYTMHIGRHWYTE